jgi:hypothetical protein
MSAMNSTNPMKLANAINAIIKYTMLMSDSHAFCEILKHKEQMGIQIYSNPVGHQRENKDNKEFVKMKIKEYENLLEK